MAKVVAARDLKEAWKKVEQKAFDELDKRLRELKDKNPRHPTVAAAMCGVDVDRAEYAFSGLEAPDEVNKPKPRPTEKYGESYDLVRQEGAPWSQKLGEGVEVYTCAEPRLWNKLGRPGRRDAKQYAVRVWGPNLHPKDPCPDCAAWVYDWFKSVNNKRKAERTDPRATTNRETSNRTISISEWLKATR